MKKWDWVVVSVVLLNIADIAVTLPNWHLEGNPVVLSLGPVGMVATKLAACVGLAGVWFLWEGVSTSKVAKVSLGTLTALYAMVVVSNVAILLG